jgi:aspartate 1-decarboxylase
MVRTLLRSKIHRAVVTSADFNYEGSLMVDSSLLEAARMHAFELVQVVDIEKRRAPGNISVCRGVGLGRDPA